MTNALVPIHEFYSALEAEMAATALSEAGIAATIQGAVAGQLLASLAPSRFPLLVAADQAETAREVLRSLGIIESLEASQESRSTARKSGWRVIRVIAGFYAFVLVSFAGITVTSVVAIAIADAIHSTPHGHTLSPIVPLYYLVPPTAVLLTFSKWARSKGLVAIVAVVMALVAASIAPRIAPAAAPPPGLRTKSRW